MYKLESPWFVISRRYHKLNVIVFGSSASYSFESWFVWILFQHPHPLEERKCFHFIREGLIWRIPGSSTNNQISFISVLWLATLIHHCCDILLPTVAIIPYKKSKAFMKTSDWNSPVCPGLFVPKCVNIFIEICHWFSRVRFMNTT